MNKNVVHQKINAVKKISKYGQRCSVMSLVGYMSFILELWYLHCNLTLVLI